MVPCKCCGQSGHVIGLGGMRKTCDECNGARFVSSDAPVVEVKPSRKKSVSHNAVVEPVDNNVVTFGE